MKIAIDGKSNHFLWQFPKMVTEVDGVILSLPVMELNISKLYNEMMASCPWLQIDILYWSLNNLGNMLSAFLTKLCFSLSNLCFLQMMGSCLLKSSKLSSLTVPWMKRNWRSSFTLLIQITPGQNYHSTGCRELVVYCMSPIYRFLVHSCILQ